MPVLNTTQFDERLFDALSDNVEPLLVECLHCDTKQLGCLVLRATQLADLLFELMHLDDVFGVHHAPTRTHLPVRIAASRALASAWR